MAQKLSSLVVDLQVQTAELRKGLNDAARRLDKFGAEAEKTNKKLETFGKVGKAFVGLFAFDQLKDGFMQLAGFIGEGITALAEEEKAAARLTAAFNNLGVDGAVLTPMFLEQADALESLTLVDAAVITQMQQLMVQMGAAPSSINGLTKAILDYSAASGKDALTSTRTLLGAVASGRGKVAEMGVEFKATGNVAADLATAGAQIEANFTGASEAANAGLAGGVGQLKKAVDDLGKSLAEMFVRAGIIAKLSEGLQGIAFALSDANAQQNALNERTEKHTETLEEIIKHRARLKELEAEQAESSEWYARTFNTAIEREKKWLAAAEARLEALNKERKAASDAATEQERLRREQLEKADALARAAAEAARLEREREEATKRAAIAAKKAAEEQRRALEAAVKLQQEQIRSALELGRAQSGIDSQVDRRRGDMAQARSGRAAQPTAGFDSFEEALARNRQALLDEAEYRNQAVQLRRIGDEAGADAAERAAAQMQDLSDATGAAADAFIQAERDFWAGVADHQRAQQQAVADAQAGVASQAQGMIPGTAGALVGAAAAAAPAGPEAVGVSVFMELLSRSEQFAEATAALDAAFQLLADTVGALLEPFMPLIEEFARFWAVLKPLTAVFKLLELVTRPLFEVLKVLHIAIASVAIGLGNMWNAIIGAIGSVLESIGLGDLDHLLVDTRSMERGLDELMRGTYDAAEATEEAASATSDLAHSASNASEEVLNAPAGFKGLANARFNAADLETGTGDDGAGGSGADVRETPIEINVNADLRRYIQIEARQDRYIRTGSAAPVRTAWSY